MTKLHNEIAKDIEDWASEKVNTIYPDSIVIPDANWILTQQQRLQLARNAHMIFTVGDIRDNVNGWRHIDKHGESLLSAVRCSYNLRSSKPSRASWQTPWQLSPLTPLPDLTMSAATTASPISPSPATPPTPVVPRVPAKRQPLGEVSNNVIRKRIKQNKI